MRIRVLSFAVATYAVAACRGGESAPQRSSLVDSRDTYDPRSLDPALSTDVPTGRAVSYVFDGLTRFTPDARVEPALAERWTISPDGLTYTFHLRRGVTVHDGTPFTAKQVVHTFERALNPATKGGRAEPLVPIKGAAEFAAMKPGAYLHVATDWEDYASQILEVLSAEPLLVNTADGYAPRPDYRPLTKFESRGLKLGHRVWDIIFTRPETTNGAGR